MRTSSSSSSCNGGNRERSNSCASTCSTGSGVSAGGQSTNLPTCRIFNVCDIVKTGYMHIKRPPTTGSVKIRLKTWQKRFFVLRDQSYQRGSARLEIYNSESSWHEDRPPAQDDCLCVDLHSVAHVTEYSESRSYPHAFTISRSGHGPLVLGAESEYDLKEWMVAIQVLSDKVRSNHTGGHSAFLEPGCRGDGDSSPRRPSCPSRLTSWSSAQQLHSSLELVVSSSSVATGPKISEPKETSKNSTRLLKLPSTAAACSNCLVTVERTPDSDRVGLEGDYYMIVLRDEIFLQRPGTLGEVITWPLSHIIKLKTEDTTDGSNLVTLEASSMCGKHAGQYLFKSNYGREIIQKVKDTMSRQASKQSTGDEELERLRVKPIARAPSSPDLLSRCSPPHLMPRAPSSGRSDTPPDVIPQSSRTIKVRSAAHLHSNTNTPTRTAQTAVRKTYSLDIPIRCPNDDDDVIEPETSLSVMASPARDCKRLSLDVPTISVPELPDDVPDVAPPDIPDMADSPPQIPSRDRKPSSSSGKKHSYLQLVDEGQKNSVSSSEKQRSSVDSIKTPSRSSPNNPKKKFSKLPPLPPSVLERTSPPKSSAVDIPPSLPKRRSTCSPPPPPPRPQHTLGSNSSPVW